MKKLPKSSKEFGEAVDRMSDALGEKLTAGLTKQVKKQIRDNKSEIKKKAWKWGSIAAGSAAGFTALMAVIVAVINKQFTMDAINQGVYKGSVRAQNDFINSLGIASVLGSGQTNPRSSINALRQPSTQPPPQYLPQAPSGYMIPQQAGSIQYTVA